MLATFFVSSTRELIFLINMSIGISFLSISLIVNRACHAVFSPVNGHNMTSFKQFARHLHGILQEEKKQYVAHTHAHKWLLSRSTLTSLEAPAAGLDSLSDMTEASDEELLLSEAGCLQAACLVSVRPMPRRHLLLCALLPFVVL